MEQEQEQSSQIQNGPNNEPEVTDVSTTTTSFDLWAYHTSKANTQIEDRTQPFYQEVLIEYYIIL